MPGSINQYASAFEYSDHTLSTSTMQVALEPHLIGQIVGHQQVPDGLGPLREAIADDVPGIRSPLDPFHPPRDHELRSQSPSGLMTAGPSDGTYHHSRGSSLAGSVIMHASANNLQFQETITMDTEISPHHSSADESRHTTLLSSSGSLGTEEHSPIGSHPTANISGHLPIPITTFPPPQRHTVMLEPILESQDGGKIDLTRGSPWRWLQRVREIAGQLLLLSTIAIDAVALVVGWEDLS